MFFNTERYDSAQETLKRLRSFDKEQPLPEVSMGLLYELSGKRDAAEKSMAAAIEKGADDLATRLAVAAWALNAGKIDQARENAQAAKSMAPDNSRADLILAMVLRYEGRDTQAEAAFRGIHEQSPASFAASNNLALTLIAQDDDTKRRQALEYAQVNVRSYQLEQDVAAEQAIQKVITSGEVSPDTSYYAACIYHRRGQVDLAISLLEGALASTKAFPDRKSAQRFLDRIRPEENVSQADDDATSDIDAEEGTATDQVFSE